MTSYTRCLLESLGLSEAKFQFTQAAKVVAVLRKNGIPIAKPIPRARGKRTVGALVIKHPTKQGWVGVQYNIDTDPEAEILAMAKILMASGFHVEYPSGSPSGGFISTIEKVKDRDD